MSLLMDALKRAPPPAQPPSPDAARAPAPLSLEPLPTPPTGLPDLANHIEAVNADLAATARQAAVPPAASVAETIQAQTRNAFLARDPPPAAVSSPTYWLAAAGLLAALGLGVYFWWQWQAQAQHPLATLPPASARPATPPAPQASLPPPSPLPSQSPPRPAPADIQRAMAGNRLTYATPLPPPSPAPETGPTLRIQRTPPPLDPELQAGHRALEQKSLRQARQDFEQVLKRDPHNLDALLGLAAIAQNEGRSPVALQLYQAALAAHPKDARALAGYLGLSGSRDPEMTESRLKTLLAEQPDGAPLHFSLGNLLANAGRWHEAQQAYFNAHALDGSNPDYLFNLAVSLDRLNQPRLAAEYYRKALEAARQRPAVFDPAALNQRLQTLEEATP